MKNDENTNKEPFFKKNIVGTFTILHIIIYFIVFIVLIKLARSFWVAVLAEAFLIGLKVLLLDKMKDENSNYMSNIEDTDENDDDENEFF